MKNRAVCLLFVFNWAFANAQVAQDTIVYPEVKVEANRIPEAIGSSISEIDTSLFKQLKSKGLTQLLDMESFISTRSYSPGGVSNFSVRGSGSQHTQVVWEGIPVNDPMLGQTDLSAVSLGGVSKVRLLYGSAGLTNHSGGIGGTIELLSSTPKKANGIELNIHGFVGSFGNYGTSLEIQDRYKKVFGTTSVSWQTAKNNFKYADLSTIAQEKKQMEHANVDGWGFSKSIGIDINTKNSIVARIKVSQVKRELPPTMLMVGTEETLLDRDVWAAIKWKRIGKRSTISAMASYIRGKQEYFDNNDYTYNHLYQASKNLIRYKLSLGYNLWLDVGADIFAENARSDSAYRSETHWRQWQATFASVRYTPKKWVAAQVLVREDVIDGSFSPVQGLIGVEVKPLKWLLLKGNVSRNFRAPTLNDLYWKPGGNADLKSEKGLAWEAGIAFNWKTDKLNLRSTTTYFESNIDDWIIWLPEGSLWKPQNKRAVRSNGIETDLHLWVKVGRAIVSLAGYYTWVKSIVEQGASDNDVSVGKQLIYVPKHQAKGYLGVRISQLHFMYGHRYVGKRYTSSDNLASLPFYHLGWMSLGMTSKLQLNIRLD